jgi:hypothetical protein
MIKITTWRPDTCECEIEYEWDDTLNENVRVHKIHEILKACPVHQNLKKDKHWGIVLDENTRKNKFLGEVLKDPNLREETFDGDGNSTGYKLKKGLKYVWSFDDKRVLRAEIIGITQNQKATLQNIANTNLGNGKVVVV